MIKNLSARYSQRGEFRYKIDFSDTRRKYRNYVTNITNRNIARSRQSTKRRITIAEIRVAIKHDYRNRLNSRIAYDLIVSRNCGAIMSELELKSLKYGTETLV